MAEYGSLRFQALGITPSTLHLQDITLRYLNIKVYNMMLWDKNILNIKAKKISIVNFLHMTFVFTAMSAPGKDSGNF